MSRCEKCNANNQESANFCYNCGSGLKKKTSIFSRNHIKYVSGLGHKGVSLAPLAEMAIENAPFMIDHPEPEPCAKVITKEDGSWFCPCCGELNSKTALFCKGCSKDK
ncbi:MAG: zinc ribbon domain-containing protein [Angelakisella sp.]|nr:zinc ribbon domain-containing protein [Angelakisella sp.]